MLNSASGNNTHETHVQSIRTDIARLIEQLPVESLKVLWQFASFLQQQGSDDDSLPTQDKPAPLEIVAVPAAQISNLIGILSPGYRGNALEDTEAILDDV